MNARQLVNVEIEIGTPSLFAEFESSNAPEGLLYREGFLSGEEQKALVEWIDGQPWDEELSRRRQFYGGHYECPGAGGSMPEVVMDLARRLWAEGLVNELPDRCLVNEYLPGQGIAAHVDYHPRFGDEVVMISLLDEYPMRFAHPTGQVWEKWLARGSVCVITGPSRYEWTHEIARRKADILPDGGRKMRGRRVSVTFRKAVE